MRGIELDLRRDRIHEECGVFGIFNNGDVEPVSATHDGLYGLQHRGQESAGMTLMKGEDAFTVKDLGIVSTVFTQKSLAKLPSDALLSVGHVRYDTTNFLDRAATQPLVMRYIDGSLAIANNGCITNFAQIRAELERGGAIFQSNSHAEVIGYKIATNRIDADTIEEAVLKTMDELKGAYSLVIGTADKLIGVRDPHGFKPLCIGRVGESYVISSESCAIDSVGGEFVRDVKPGEVVVIDSEGLHSYFSSKNKNESLCMFEYVYLSRPDSFVDGLHVNLVRREAGVLLYEENPIEADIVCGVPDSGLSAAQGYAEASGIPYANAFIKNKYIGRTTEGMGTNKMSKLLKVRLNVMKNIVDGKRVVVIDDSIVRGNTCAYIIDVLRKAGAKEVHMRISSPEFKYPCYFGVDLPKKEQLASNNYSVEELKDKIGADSLGFLSLDGFRKIAKESNIGLCDGCFSGNYKADKPTELYIDKFANKIHKV